MNYDFPEIKTIQDVLPHIEGRDEFRVMDKDWLRLSVAIAERGHTRPAL